MKTFFITILAALVVSTSASRVPYESVQIFPPTALEQKQGLAIQGRSLSSGGKEALENFINKLPCGWPEAGIPPLAPYTKDQIVFEIKKSFAEAFADLEHFRIDGLDILIINKLKINYVLTKKVKFNLLLPRVIISGKLKVGGFLDLMKEYGVSLKYNGTGEFEVILENIIFEGQFKYKMPYVFGTIKIYKFDGSITLGNVISNINGIVGEGKLKKILNEQVEDIILKAVSLNQDKISGALENDLVPYVNKKLKGRKIWSVIRSLFGKKGKICYPPADPGMSI